MSGAGNTDGSWGYIFSMELLRRVNRADLDVYPSIPEDYPGPFRGDIAFHATHPPAFAAYDCVRARIDNGVLQVHSLHQGRSQTEFMRLDCTDDEPLRAAGQAWRDCVHGAVAWMCLQPRSGTVEVPPSRRQSTAEGLMQAIVGELANRSGFRRGRTSDLVYTTGGGDNDLAPRLLVNVSGSWLLSRVRSPDIPTLELNAVHIEPGTRLSPAIASWETQVGRPARALIDHLSRLEHS